MHDTLNTALRFRIHYYFPGTAIQARHFSNNEESSDASAERVSSLPLNTGSPSSDTETPPDSFKIKLPAA